jgi:hypothetical protein
MNVYDVLSESTETEVCKITQTFITDQLIYYLYFI